MTDFGTLARGLYQRPHVIVTVGTPPNRRVIDNVISAHVEIGYDMAVPTATVTVATGATPFWKEHDDITVDMGYVGPGGRMQNVFKGEVENDNRKYSPRMLDIAAAGYSKRLQRPFGNLIVSSLNPDPVPAFTYNSQTDSQIWNDLMRRAGVPRYDAGTGDSLTYATLNPINVQAGTKLGDLVSKLDESSKNGQRTFEMSGVVMRRPVLSIPSLSVSWKYAEGAQGLTDPYVPIIDITRNVSDKNIQNQATVTGIGSASAVDATAAPVTATVQAASSLLGKDGDGNDIYIPHSLTSDFLETRAECLDVAKRYMKEFNKLTDDITIKVALNPAIVPGHSIGVLSTRMDITTLTSYWVRHITHEYSASGAFTTLQCEGGVGADGYLIGLPPVAGFTMTVTEETFIVGGVLDTWHTVTCDGTTSYDPDGNIASYAWTATNGASGSGETWAVRFTDAQWADAATSITLTVTDTDTDPTGPHTNALTQAVTSAKGDDTQQDGIYLAGGTYAAASADGGKTWGVYSPPGGAHVISVSHLSGGSTQYFGQDDGKVILTTDHFATAAVLKYTFAGRQVTAIWINEVDNNKVAMGLDNGDVWITLDAFATAPTLRRNFSWPINWIEGSTEQISQWRVATGSYVWITYDDFVTVGTLSTQANTVEQVELSNFANYNVENTDATVKVESVGTTVAWPALTPAPTDARLAHFIRTDELMAGDDQGRAFVKAPSASAFTQVTPIGGGRVNALIASRNNPKVFYAGCATGLYKTYDAGVSWYEVRAGQVLQLALDSEPATVRIVATLIEFVSVPKSSGTGVDGGGQLIPEGGTAIPTEWTAAMSIQNHYAQGKYYVIDHNVDNNPMITFPGFQTRAYAPDGTWTNLEYAWGGYSQEYLPRAWSTGPHQLSGLYNNSIMQWDSYMMFRHNLAIPTPPTGTYKKAIITFMGWFTFDRIWLNDVVIYGDGTRMAQQQQMFLGAPLPFRRGVSQFFRCDVTDLIVPGATNLLSGFWESFATGLVPGAMCYRLSLSTGDQIAAVTEGPGTTYVTTVEESRGFDLLNMATMGLHPSGFTGARYLASPPAGWTDPAFDDSTWGYNAAPIRWHQSLPNVVTNNDLRVNLESGSQWVGTRQQYPTSSSYSAYGCGSAIRQHWQIPSGTYTSAKLSLRWIHTIAVWLNGTLVYQNNDDNVPQPIGGTPTTGKLHEILDIDVLANLRPGADNVLCIQVQRADYDAKIWFPGDFVGACAKMVVQ